MQVTKWNLQMASDVGVGQSWGTEPLTYGLCTNSSWYQTWTELQGMEKNTHTSGVKHVLSDDCYVVLNVRESKTIFSYFLIPYTKTATFTIN